MPKRHRIPLFNHHLHCSTDAGKWQIHVCKHSELTWHVIYLQVGIGSGHVPHAPRPDSQPTIALDHTTEWQLDECSLGPSNMYRQLQSLD